MSDDSVTVRSSQSWFSRIGGAIVGALIGIFLFIAAFPFLVWNEGRAIKRAKTLEAGAEAVVSAPASPVQAENEGRLVHITGKTLADGQATDSALGVSAAAIKLHRNVEMYQWSEEKKSETKSKLGGGEETVTTYSYKKEWSSTLIDSQEFQKTDGHTNPSEMPLESETFAANVVTVGDFTLPDSLVAMIDDYQAFPVKQMPEISTEFSAPVALSNNGLYIGENPKTPAVGDLRIAFTVVEPGDVSIVAGQIGETFEPYVINGLGTIELLQTGTVSAKNMFASEQQANTVLTWILRVVGFFVMFIGLLLIAKPLTVVADFIPILGSIAETGTGFISFLVALPLTLGTIALAWLAYRPLLGLPLLILAVVGIVFAIRAVLKRKKKAPLPA